MFFLIIPALFLFGFVLFIVFRAGRGGFPGGRGGACGRPMRAHHGTARELLDQRYARGEIDHEQYLKMKDALD